MIGCAGLLAGSAHRVAAQSSAVSMELKTMYEDDQAERMGGRLSPERDRERLERARELLLAGELRTAEDYYHASMLFQHSADRSGRDHLRAHVLGVAAAMLGHEGARWLSAAALDRYLVFNEMDQFFGTQFERDGEGLWHPGVLDSQRTEALRELFGIPTAEEMQLRADGFNP